MQRHDVVIVGSGHGGAQAALVLRQLGFSGSVAMIGDEPELPYERPPLSKAYLGGEKAFEQLLIRPENHWRAHRVDLILGARVTQIDPTARAVTLQDGRTLGYGALIWAAGGEPRRLSCPGSDLGGVHLLRTHSDVLAIMAELVSVKRVAIIGGGYIGLEVAATLSKLGKAVVLLEALDRVLSRVAGDAISNFFAAEHRAHGVDVRTGVKIAAIEGEAGRARAIRLVTGEVVPADMVIVGIGIAPNIQPMLDAGADVGDGVIVDRFCRSGIPDVFAIGDCAAHANGFAEAAVVRLESVQNANDQALTAAKAVMRAPEPYQATPWFWSDQYDLKLQTVGLSAGHDNLIIRGDPASRNFSVIYFRAGRVIALDCVNATRDYVHGRKLVETGVTPRDPSSLSDPSRPLKDYLSARG